MAYEAIRYRRGSLEILDQLQVPHVERYVSIRSPQEGWQAIKSMQVRGAPAIAIVAALSVAVWFSDPGFTTQLETEGAAKDVIRDELEFLLSSRPTAVNLQDAVNKLQNVVDLATTIPDANNDSICEAYVLAAEHMLISDVKDNKAIGAHGAQWILDNCLPTRDRDFAVLTHCNTGSLATAGYGTALGIVRSLFDHPAAPIGRVYYTETRPYLQGARLTGFELDHERIPASLITDSMAAALMQLRPDGEEIACVVVGADRVAANGDTANKIGTYGLAILAKYHGVKFVVAAPRTTIDLNTHSGAAIKIEQRPTHEMYTISGVDPASDAGTIKQILIAPAHTKAWNPSFDVTPAALIDAIVTEKGVIEKSSDGEFDFGPIFRR